MPRPWDPDFAGRSPLFAPLRAPAAALRTPCWPGCADLNRLLATSGRAILTVSGKPLRFVDPLIGSRRREDKFEPRTFLHGEVQFRSRDWHDLFNALVWLTFPHAKAALNGRHYVEGERQRASGASNRGPVQDALTLFDESGMIVAVCEPALAGLLAGYRWKELFWQRRADVAHGMRFYIFGHALYEKGLEPFRGVTARAAVFNVSETFFHLSIGEQIAELDRRLAMRINDSGHFSGTRELPPVPVLGIPGWSEDNAHEQYYNDTRYFRSAPAGTR